MSPINIQYKIAFYSDWLCSSGLTGHSDNLPIQDTRGVPFIPGKTLKGLLREAAEHYKQFLPNQDWQKMIDDCFGKNSDTSDVNAEKQSNDQRDFNQQCFFSNATLSRKMQLALDKNNKPQKNKLLFRDITSTQLDKDGQAKDHSLRSVTVVVPLTLFAEIDKCPEEYADKMRKCLMWIKHIGCLRNRGFGRCKLEELQS